MKNRRTILLLFVILIVNLALAIIFRDFIRENVLIPLLYLFWIIRLLLKSLGETCLWPVLMIILALISLRLLRVKQKDRQRVRDFYKEAPRQEEGRVSFWMKYIRRKTKGVESLSFTSFRLRELVLSVLAYQQNLASSELETKLSRGEIIVPEMVGEIVFQQEQAISPRERSRSIFSSLLKWFKIRSLPETEQTASDLRALVQFLEERLEIEHHDGN